VNEAGFGSDMDMLVEDGNIILVLINDLLESIVPGASSWRPLTRRFRVRLKRAACGSEIAQDFMLARSNRQAYFARKHIEQIGAATASAFSI
jgi:hypothetical protein